jgi:acyl-CoA ligase (AMP-forming) (exosortase A-associated)
MSELLHNLVQNSASCFPLRVAIVDKGDTVDYRSLWEQIEQVAYAFSSAGCHRGERIGVYLDKRLETLVAIFGAAAAGCVFVPINPVLKPRQVGYIIRDCEVKVLVTSRQRFSDLTEELGRCYSISLIVLVDRYNELPDSKLAIIDWPRLMAEPRTRHPSHIIDSDMAAILYTSGSTGSPKGVVLSHRNLVVGARSVSSYLENHSDDRILSVLPLSFDAGLSQVTTAFAVGARVILLNYALPHEVVRACSEANVTGITGVPPLWIQLAKLDWPETASRSVRYFANTGGHMPRATLQRLRALLPRAKSYLMYGLTESFRSTYLDPAEVDHRPDSIGKAIPNAEVLVVRSDGTLCDANEPGELVHRGALVAMGYWNDSERTAERFRPAPCQPSGVTVPEIAVWSGDIVRRDEEGFLYFVGRRDEMIKTSGYRVSPTEVEEVIYASGLVSAAAVIGVPHPQLGQAIVAVVTVAGGVQVDVTALMAECRRNLPQYMVPLLFVGHPVLPCGPNGKIDRKLLQTQFLDVFAGGAL